jgi:LmbE family N-acetylglucosaminyl deacetylase
MNKVVLVIAAHADDEALGCGGTIAKHAAQGDEVHVVLMADGVGSRGGKLEDSLRARTEATRRAMTILNVKSWHALGFPDNRMDSLPLLDIVQPLETIISKVAPHTIYTHHYGDLNVDHRITHQATLTACRPLPSSPIREILTFEIMSSTEWSSSGLAPFLPNFYVDISEYQQIKMRALDAYGLEMRPAPHSRSVEHLNSLVEHHGYCVGVRAAEAFMVIRMIR